MIEEEKDKVKKIVNSEDKHVFASEDEGGDKPQFPPDVIPIGHPFYGREEDDVGWCY